MLWKVGSRNIREQCYDSENRKFLGITGNFSGFGDNFCQIKIIPLKILRFCRLNIPPREHQGIFSWLWPSQCRFTSLMQSWLLLIIVINSPYTTKLLCMPWQVIDWTSNLIIYIHYYSKRMNKIVFFFKMQSTSDGRILLYFSLLHCYIGYISWYECLQVLLRLRQHEL